MRRRSDAGHPAAGWGWWAAAGQLTGARPNSPHLAHRRPRRYPPRAGVGREMRPTRDYQVILRGRRARPPPAARRAVHCLLTKTTRGAQRPTPAAEASAAPSPRPAGTRAARQPQGGSQGAAVRLAFRPCGWSWGARALRLLGWVDRALPGCWGVVCLHLLPGAAESPARRRMGSTSPVPPMGHEVLLDAASWPITRY